MAEVRSVSYGGGIQSTALLVLASQGRIDFRLFLFSNVGDDSEHPATLRYVRDVAMPYAAEHGIELVELHRVPQRGIAAGQIETLYGRLMREGSRSLPIPVRMSNGAPGTRSCTADFKIRVIGRELQRRGATVEDPATVALGISVDEIERATPGRDPRAPYQVRTYPLLDLGLNRRDCASVIADAGLPVPPKSACWFCPFHDREAWRRLKRDEPDLFVRACDSEYLNIAEAPNDPTIADQLDEAWRLLEAQGAVVRRLPLSSLSRGEAAVLLWHERRRLRVLMERHAPDPPPFNWRAYRVSLVARPAAHRNAPTAAYLRREAA